MASLFRVTSLALMGLALSLTVCAQAAESSDVVKIDAKADKIEADGTQVVTITFDIDKDWHLYANPVGPDSFKRNQVSVESDPKQKLNLVKVEYPEGTEKVDPDLGKYRIYEGKITVKATFKRAKGDTDPVELQIKIAACSAKKMLCNNPNTLKVTAK